MKLRTPFLVNAAATLFAMAMRAVFLTVKMRIDAYADTDPYSKSNEHLYLYSTWHDSAVMAIFGGRHTRMAALTSLHRDGDFAAKAMAAVGITLIRGSTGRRGSSALREMIRAAEDKHVVLMPDGPRGPRRQATRGIVFLASTTGRPIVPTAFTASKSLAIRGSWTDLTIPRPFATVYARSAEPIVVPPNLSRAQLDVYVARLQKAMDQLNGDSRAQSKAA